MHPIQESSVTGKGLKPVYVVCMHTGGTPLSNMVKMFTGNEFTHAAISFNPDFSPLYSFGKKQTTEGPTGFTVDDIHVPFYWDRNIHWAAFVVFVDDDSYNLMKEKIQWFVRRSSVFRFNFAGILKIAANLPSENRLKYFCSSFVSDILQVGGLNVEKSYTLYSPQDLANLYAAYEVGRGESFRELNKMTIIRNTDKMRRKYIQDHQNK